MLIVPRGTLGQFRLADDQLVTEAERTGRELALDVRDEELDRRVIVVPRNNLTASVRPCARTHNVPYLDEGWTKLS
jgi:hypothetical protein